MAEISPVKKFGTAFANNKFVQSYSRFITDPKSQKVLNLTLLLVIVAAIPLTVFITQQQNDLRQRAEGLPVTPATPPQPPSPYVCTYTESSITNINSTKSTTMSAGTPFTYTVKFNVNTSDPRITHFYGFYDNKLRINVPATCTMTEANKNNETSTHVCSWQLNADAVPGIHELSLYLRDYIDSTTNQVAYEKTQCLPMHGISLAKKVYIYTVPDNNTGNTPLITPPPSWDGPKVSYLVTPQNPKKGRQFSVAIKNRSQAIQYIALLVNGTPHWASSGGGGEDTSWNISVASNSAQVKVQLVGNCDYNNGNSVGPKCTDPNAKYNEATIQLLP